MTSNTKWRETSRESSGSLILRGRVENDYPSDINKMIDGILRLRHLGRIRYGILNSPGGGGIACGCYGK